MNVEEFIDDLKWRGLIYQVTNEDLLVESLNLGSKVYCGVDPTASSLHIGHIVPFITMKRFLKAGHKAVVLLGGATGTIGDPSGRSAERNLLSFDEVLINSNNLKVQLENLLGDNSEVSFFNNIDWVGNISLIDFLRDYGKLINVNYMLNKESVSSRLDNGLSFTEFSYTLIQGMDFQHLNKFHDVDIQIGGSDQWGNITTGLEMIRKVNPESKALGLTIPLIKKSDGTKFGKTAGGAIWLDKNLTSVYDFYQFWFNTSDEDVISYLKFFTLLSKEEIELIEFEFNKDKGLRFAQQVLAEQMTVLIHGENELFNVLNQKDLMVNGNLLKLNAKDFLNMLGNLEVTNVNDFSDKRLVNFLVSTNIIESNRRAREDILSGAIKINGSKVLDINYEISNKDFLFKDLNYIFIEKGKKIKKILFICENM